MNTLGDSYRQYRAPQTHATALVEPGLGQAGQLTSANRLLRHGQGSFSWQMQQAARSKIVDHALQYTRAYRDVDWATQRIDQSSLDELSIFMSGHQPTLFHPGVWFKNFALSHLGRQHHAIAINLVVDNDVSAGSSLRVPTLRRDTDGSDQVRRRVIAYDDSGGGIPYEQTLLKDCQQLEQFDREVAAAISGIVDEPSIGRLWNHVRDAIASCGKVGCAFARARHALEAELGLQTLEVPLSIICGDVEFAQFALSILTDLERFQFCYNAAADHYRDAHGIRSSAHPVPNLGRQADWFETPFWVYSDDDPKRKPLWGKVDGDLLCLGDSPSANLDGRCRQIKLTDAASAARQLSQQMTADFKLRPRALITTMYARLILSDLFLHGIGGGKYDQLGDRIIEQFFSIEPPQFMVISATIQLPATRRTGAEKKIRQIKRDLRDTRYQPERFRDQAELKDELIQRKRQLIDGGKPSIDAKRWHDEMTAINRELSKSLEPIRQRLEQELSVARNQQVSDVILTSREHSFCLHPLSHLVEAMKSMLANDSAAIGA